MSALSTRHITAKIAPWLDDAIEEHGMGENIAWDTVIIPDQQGVPRLTILFWMPGAVLGEAMQGSIQIVNPLQIDEDEIDKVVQNFLHQFRDARSQQVSPHAAPRGQHPSGLLLPG